jgi:hypothetical protein
MGRTRALANRPLHQSKENRPPVSAVESPQRVRAKKLGWLEKLEPARCGYSGQTSTGNNKDAGDGCDSNDARTDSMGGNSYDNKVSRNTCTDNSNRKGNIRNSPDRSRY